MRKGRKTSRPCQFTDWSKNVRRIRRTSLLCQRRGESLTALTATEALKTVAVFSELFAFGTAIVTSHRALPLAFPQEKPDNQSLGLSAGFVRAWICPVASLTAGGGVFLFATKSVRSSYIA
ncbi:MAG: hypothetical protein KGJ13_11315, partial [Patescibacteria group bacterium]|nr:hypothetical protein [Patescibacteria group bacterium]